MIVHAARADDSLLALRSARRDGPHRQRARATGRSRALTLSAFRLLSPAAPALPSSPSVENFLANSRSGFYGSERPVTGAGRRRFSVPLSSEFCAKIRPPGVGPETGG